MEAPITAAEPLDEPPGENHPAVFRRLSRHVMKRRLPKGNRAVEVVAMNDDGPDLHSPLR
jgi:hypothetical protein